MSDQKLDIATVEAAPKSITNIYYDCLERIFDFLDLKSLMNVAGTCKRLQIAAAAKFADDFGHASVMLYEDDGYNNNSIWYIYVPRASSIHVFGLRFCLTFLRCFGAKILNLSITSSNLRSRSEYVGRYMNQYCADMLISIFLTSARSFSSENIIRPFKAVEKLVFRGCNLGDQLLKFVDWFPKLNHLTSSGLTSINRNAIAVYFPHLEHLTLDIVYGYHFVMYSIQ